MASISGSAASLPAMIESESQLEDVLTSPSAALLAAMEKLEGDLLILGIAGKMGPTMARLARRALDQAGKKTRIIGVARFTKPELRDRLEASGIETITADLLERGILGKLPDSPNVIYLAGMKFGSTGQEEMTWAMNAYLPALVADRYRGSRIVALSTGNVYPFTPILGPWPGEQHPVGPVGEYAQSCLGRERMFQYFSLKDHTPIALIRLNYATDLRYGVLVDVARKVFSGTTINLSMGYANVIWQGDANEAILRCLEHCSAPAFVLNLTGPQPISIREMAEEFGRKFNKKPILEGREERTALLSDATRYVQLLGQPKVTIERLIQWVAFWVQKGGPFLDKPTHYDARDGKF